MINLAKRKKLLALLDDVLSKYDVRVLPIEGDKDFSGRGEVKGAVEYIEQFNDVIVRMIVKGSNYHVDGNGYIGFIALHDIQGDNELIIEENIALF